MEVCPGVQSRQCPRTPEMPGCATVAAGSLPSGDVVGVPRLCPVMYARRDTRVHCGLIQAGSGAVHEVGVRLGCVSRKVGQGLVRGRLGYVRVKDVVKVVRAGSQRRCYRSLPLPYS